MWLWGDSAPWWRRRELQQACIKCFNMKYYLYYYDINNCDVTTTDPLLPALVESMGLVHAVPVAAKVAAVSVVEVAVLIAEVATVTTSLVVLRRDRATD